MPCFVKQMGSNAIGSEYDMSESLFRDLDANGYDCSEIRIPFRKKGGIVEEWAEELRVQEFPEVRHE